MNIPKRFPMFSRLSVALSVVAVAVVTCMAPPAQAQLTPNNRGQVTLLSTVAATNDVVTATSTAIDVPPNRPIVLFPEFRMMAAATGNVVWTVQLSADGTNYTTASGLTYTVAANGTNLVRGLWVLDPTEIGGALKVRISQFSNAANAAVLTNAAVVYSTAAPP